LTPARAGLLSRLPRADTVPVKNVNATTSESTFKKGGKVTATNTRVMAADGKTLTVTSKGVTVDGKPRNDVRSWRSRT
jgi:hypothetical protein